LSAAILSVSLEDVEPQAWVEKICQRDIIGKPGAHC